MRDRLRIGRTLAALGMTLVLGSAVTLAQDAGSGPGASEQLKAGTQLAVRITTPLNSTVTRMGQTWTGVLVNNVAVGDQVAMTQGAPVSGIVVAARGGGRMKGKASIALQVTSVNGVMTLTDTLTRDSAGHTKSNMGYIGGGAALGAGIGAIGGGTGAGIGAATGAATGTVQAVMSGRRVVEIPAESVLTFTVK